MKKQEQLCWKCQRTIEDGDLVIPTRNADASEHINCDNVRGTLTARSERAASASAGFVRLPLLAAVAMSGLMWLSIIAGIGRMAAPIVQCLSRLPH